MNITRFIGYNYVKSHGDHMSVNQLIQFITRELILFIDTPSEERKKRKVTKKEQRSPWSNHWFGAVPIAIGMFVKRRKF